MKLRSTKTWITRDGKQRVIRLYNNWRNLNSRTRGTSRHGPQSSWSGKEVEWKTFEEFRRWALDWGYSKKFCSLDRIDINKGYTSANCQWLTVALNTSRENQMRRTSKTDQALYARIYANVGVAL